MDRVAGSERLKHAGDEFHLVREVVRTYQTLMAAFSHKMGMPSARFELLRQLAITEVEVGVMDLSRLLGVNAAAVTRQVQDLELQGLVERRADPIDRRRSFVRLSPEGQRLFDLIHERSHEVERALLLVLGEDEMQSAVEVLAKLRTFVEEFR